MVTRPPHSVLPALPRMRARRSVTQPPELATMAVEEEVRRLTVPASPAWVQGLWLHPLSRPRWAHQARSRLQVCSVAFSLQAHSVRTWLPRQLRLLVATLVKVLAVALVLVLVLVLVWHVQGRTPRL